MNRRRVRISNLFASPWDSEIVRLRRHPDPSLPDRINADEAARARLAPILFEGEEAAGLERAHELPGVRLRVGQGQEHPAGEDQIVPAPGQRRGQEVGLPDPARDTLGERDACGSAQREDPPDRRAMAASRAER